MPKTIPTPCSKEEIDALINVASDNDFYYTLFMVAKTTGRRLGEYYNVKVSDINFEQNVMMTEIKKRRQYIKKPAILREDITRMLKLYIIRKRLKDDDFVFRDVKYNSIQKAVSSYAKKANISHPVSFHNFRHYFITELVKKGWHYDQIAKLTGHSTPQTIIHYDHALATDLKEMAEVGIKDM